MTGTTTVKQRGTDRNGDDDNNHYGVTHDYYKHQAIIQHFPAGFSTAARIQ
jgi:hypothetical protein